MELLSGTIYLDIFVPYSRCLAIINVSRNELKFTRLVYIFMLYVSVVTKNGEKINLSLQQTMETYSIVRRRGSHII